MKKSELRQIIKEEISELTSSKASATPASKEGTVSGGSLSTLVAALKNIDIEDPKISNILGKLKNLSYKPSIPEQQIITNVFRAMINTKDDAALTKVFSALKNMEAKISD